MLETARTIELELYPWQVVVCTYLEALAPSIGFLWPEVATLAGRQNGKTSVLELLLLTRIRRGLRAMHSAQNRELPRESHDWLGEQLGRYFPGELARNGFRSSSGQESITLKNGGHYRIAAATRKGARGPSNDLVVVDETLELSDFDFIAAAKPTLMSSSWAQIAYFSNAGTDDSVVLSALRLRADADSNLAYLEWSAAKEDDPADPRVWAKANPTIGHNPATLPNLEREYQANLLGGTLDIWEREHLCRWAPSPVGALLLQPDEWARNEHELEGDGRRCVMGVKVDPDGSRCSAVISWQTDDGRVALDLVADVTGDPIDMSRLGPDLLALAKARKVRAVIFDPWTDADLARYFRKSTPVGGRDYAAATEKLVTLAQSKQLVIRDPARIFDRDLAHTVRSNARGGTFTAIKDGPDVTNTTTEAAIRAAWVASAPQPRPAIY
jgi:hypothetical protein